MTEQKCDHLPESDAIVTKCRYCGVMLLWNAARRAYQEKRADGTKRPA